MQCVIVKNRGLLSSLEIKTLLKKIFSLGPLFVLEVLTS